MNDNTPQLAAQRVVNRVFVAVAFAYGLGPLTLALVAAVCRSFETAGQLIALQVLLWLLAAFYAAGSRK